MSSYCNAPDACHAYFSIEQQILFKIDGQPSEPKSRKSKNCILNAAMPFYRIERKPKEWLE